MNVGLVLVVAAIAGMFIWAWRRDANRAIRSAEMSMASIAALPDHSPASVIEDAQRLGEVERTAKTEGYLLGFGHGLRVAAQAAGLAPKEPT